MRKKIVALFLAVALLVGVGGVSGVLNLATSPLALMTDHELPSLVPEAQAAGSWCEITYKTIHVGVWALLNVIPIWHHGQAPDQVICHPHSSGGGGGGDLFTP